MIRLILLSLFMFCTMCDEAYAQIKVTGKVRDVDGQPLPGANALMLKTKDSSLLKGYVTNGDGVFTIDQIKADSFIISIRMTGYRRKDTLVLSRDADLNREIILKDLVVEASRSQLKQVDVTAQKPLYEQKIDKLVVNVQQNISSAGGTALDILERSPGVTVERQQNTISLNARAGILIMINGKVSRLPMDAIIQQLGSMSSANIEKIELISNPSAQYDASGNGGIINIVLKRPAEYGTNGTYNVTLGYGLKEKLGAGININHRAEKVNIYGDFSFYRNHTSQRFENARTVKDGTDNNYTGTVSKRDPVTTNFSAQVGLDYNVSRKTTIGGFVTGYSNKWVMDANNDVTLQVNNISAGSIGIVNNETNTWKNLGGNIYLTHEIRKGSSVSVDIDYLYYDNDNPTRYRNRYYDAGGVMIIDSNLMASKKTPVNIWVGKSDYTVAFNDNINLEAGVKGSYSKFENNVLLNKLENHNWTEVPDFSQSSEYKEKIGAAYVALNTSLSSKTNLNVGMRYEYADIDLNILVKNSGIKRNFNNLFPTLFFSHDINKQQTIQFSYGRRITRPSFSDLAPFVIFIDPTAYYYGNANLLAAITDGVKLDYKFLRYLLSLQYSHESNAFAQNQPVIDSASNVEVLTTLNLKYRDTYSLMFAAPFKVNKWWNIQVNCIGSIRKVMTSHLDNNVSINQSYLRLNLVQRFKLPAGISMELMGVYRSPGIAGISKTSAAGSVDVGLQKKILKDKGALRLNVSDLFWTNIDKQRLDIPGNNLDVRVLYRYEPRICRLNFTYNFGSNKVKKPEERESGAEEVGNRVH
ncbi:TonB dependent receptor [Chitinophaga sp.]|uniref:TonB dependent receptor n=1 Tax=Chitinophaga sp. TaxID=1869181 RepID=UPI0031D6C9EC